jgi:hypothetical protein
MVMRGKAITTDCNLATGQNGVMNWNPWVGSASGPAAHASPALELADQVCIEGVGVGNYAGLCSFACSYGYCPLGACTCTRMGKQVPLPTKEDTPGFGTVGFPAEGLDATYSGLCSFNCHYGFCPPGACGTTKHPLTVPTVSPFLPNACTGGTGEGNIGGLCSYACAYGFCPIGSVSSFSSRSKAAPAQGYTLAQTSSVELFTRTSSAKANESRSVHVRVKARLTRRRLPKEEVVAASRTKTAASMTACVTSPAREDTAHPGPATRKAPGIRAHSSSTSIPPFGTRTTPSRRRFRVTRPVPLSCPLGPCRSPQRSACRPSPRDSRLSIRWEPPSSRTATILSRH